jgi:hypothetical protein
MAAQIKAAAEEAAQVKLKLQKAEEDQKSFKLVAIGIAALAAVFVLVKK